ncbi:hypothetical protein [Candidatus Nitrososphaera sp. FF02]
MASIFSSPLATWNARCVVQRPNLESVSSKAMCRNAMPEKQGNLA